MGLGGLIAKLCDAAFYLKNGSRQAQIRGPPAHGVQQFKQLRARGLLEHSLWLQAVYNRYNLPTCISTRMDITELGLSVWDVSVANCRCRSPTLLTLHTILFQTPLVSCSVSTCTPFESIQHITLMPPMPNALRQKSMVVVTSASIDSVHLKAPPKAPLKVTMPATPLSGTALCWLSLHVHAAAAASRQSSFRV